jgi:hypothetical protein
MLGYQRKNKIGNVRKFGISLISNTIHAVAGNSVQPEVST